MVHVNTVHQSDPIIGVGTASLTDPVFHLKKGLKGEKESNNNLEDFSQVI